MCHVPHVWAVRVQSSSLDAGVTTTTMTTTHTTDPPQLMAKIYDPVLFEDDETQWDDPFVLHDLAVSCEVEAYQRLGPLQGTKVPRFYGYFAAAVPAQQGRTVYIILLEEVPGRDLRAIVLPDVTENVCAIIDAALRLALDILACGVNQQDLQPRNVILRPQQHVLQTISGTRFCETKECLLVLGVDCDGLHMVMVDFEMVDFEEPDASFSEEAVQTADIETYKSMYQR
jgi:hypothetical protein